MSEIHLRGTFPAIGRAELAEFTMLAEQVLAAVRAEPGVLQYDVFLSPDQARAVALQRYGSAALLRSLVVAPQKRGRRLGCALVAAHTHLDGRDPILDLFLDA